MNNTTRLISDDGHIFNTYISTPNTTPRGAIIVMHEIFGVTRFIQDICDLWSAEGYLALAPSLYDRLSPDIVFTYDDTSFEDAVSHKAALMATCNQQGVTGWDLQLIDIQGCIHYLQQHYPTLPIMMTGFCWGGTMCWLAACRLSGLTAVCSYYGTHTYDFIDETPSVPFMLHAADFDTYLTTQQVEEIKAQHPDLLIYHYQALHAFRCHYAKSYAPEASKLADLRTKEFFQTYGIKA